MENPIIEKLSGNTGTAGIRIRSILGHARIVRGVSVDEHDRIVTISCSDEPVSEFNFLPLHRVYSFDSGSEPKRTYIVVELNLPSGVQLDDMWVEVDEDCACLQIKVVLPDYMLNALKFNELKPEKSEMLLHSSRLISCSKSALDIRRKFVGIRVKATARILLPRKVDEDISDLKVTKSGCVEKSPSATKANGLALEVQLLAMEEFSIKILPNRFRLQFSLVDSEVVQEESTSADPTVSNVTQ